MMSMLGLCKIETNLIRIGHMNKNVNMMKIRRMTYHLKLLVLLLFTLNNIEGAA